MDSGEHTVAWDAADASGRPVASGAYFVRLKSGDEDTSTKLVVIR
jgi:hypothetical protein